MLDYILIMGVIKLICICIVISASAMLIFFVIPYIIIDLWVMFIRWRLRRSYKITKNIDLLFLTQINNKKDRK